MTIVAFNLLSRNIIIDSNIVQIHPHVSTFFRRHLEFWGEAITSEGRHGYC